MIIGYDARSMTCLNTGTGSYARTLTAALAHALPKGTEMNLYAPDGQIERLSAMFMDTANVRLVHPDGNANALSRLWWQHHEMAERAVHDGVKLFHGLAGELPQGLREAGVRTVVTIHDVIFMRHPEYFSYFSNKLRAWQFRRTCLAADRIIAASECTKRDITLFGGVSAEKVDVIYQSCGSIFKLRESEKKMQEVHTEYMLPQRYIVSVGTIEERKNIILAVKAMRMLPDDVSLVVVGQTTPYGESVKQYVREEGLANRVLFLHDVPHDALPSIYQMAEACVYPSRYEGFGIPVIEAIESGLPVVACTGSSIEEAGGNDTIYVSPDDAYAMAEAVKSVLKGAPGREERISRAQQYIRRFNERDITEKVLDVYRNVLRNN